MFGVLAIAGPACQFCRSVESILSMRKFLLPGGALLTQIRVGVLTMRHAQLVLRNAAKLLTVTLSDVRYAIEIEHACHAVRRSVEMLV